MLTSVQTARLSDGGSYFQRGPTGIGSTRTLLERLRAYLTLRQLAVRGAVVPSLKGVLGRAAADNARTGSAQGVERADPP